MYINTQNNVLAAIYTTGNLSYNVCVYTAFIQRYDKLKYIAITFYKLTLNQWGYLLIAIYTTGRQHVYMAEIFEGHILQLCQSC
jgi:hypothetical protein